MIVQNRASFLEEPFPSSSEDESNMTAVPNRMTEIPTTSADGIGAKHLQESSKWKPYKIRFVIPSFNVDYDTTTYRFNNNLDSAYVENLKSIVNETMSSITTSAKALDESIRETVARTYTQLTEPTLRELRNLEQKVEISGKDFLLRIDAIDLENQKSILLANGIQRDLYVVAKRFLDAVVALAQITLKPAQKQSPKGKIPFQFLDSSSSLLPSLDLEVPSPQSHRPYSRTRTTSQDDFNVGTSAISSKDSSQNSIALTYRSTDISTKSLNAEATTSTGLQKLRRSLGMLIHPSQTHSSHMGFELPDSLMQGNPQLLPGIHNFVLPVHADNLGSIVAYMLCSGDYMHCIDAQYPSIKVKDMYFDEAHRNQSSNARHSDCLKGLTSSIQSNIKTEICFDCKQVRQHFSCTSYFSTQFHCLRHLSGHFNVSYIESLASSKSWDTSGGKSGAGFSKTSDGKYILKEIPQTELNMFLQMALPYFKYLRRVFQQDAADANNSVLCKILGVYQILQTEANGGGILLQKRKSTYVLVMENLFQDAQNLSMMYDLKGLVRRRFVEDSVGSNAPRWTVGENSKRVVLQNQRSRIKRASKQVAGENSQHVLQDGNFIDRIPVPVLQRDFVLFLQGIESDTSFLSMAGVIDYSLLLGFDEGRRELVVGLIDYVHQFDFLKKMESTSKASVTFHYPTIISPIPYKNRFVEAMQRYFVGIEAPLTRNTSHFSPYDEPVSRTNRSATLPTIISPAMPVSSRRNTAHNRPASLSIDTDKEIRTNSMD